jgi:hypothetical protein
MRINPYSYFKHNLFYFFFLLFFTFYSLNGFCKTYTSASSGNWSTISWTCSAAPCTIPQAGDDVVINHDVTFNVSSASLNSLTVSETVRLTINAGTTLRLNATSSIFGRLTINGNETNGNGILDASSVLLNLGSTSVPNPASCNDAANSDILINANGVLLARDMIMTKRCLFVAAANPPSATKLGFVRVGRDFTLETQAEATINGLIMVGGNIATNQGNINIEGSGGLGVVGTATYSPANTSPAGDPSLSYCNRSSLISCPVPAGSCPFPVLAVGDDNRECTNVCNAYICSGYYLSYPLPITLVSFNATLDASQARVHLEWITSNETSNDFFTLERSTDLENFEEIQRIEGAGTTLTLQTYQAYDMQPLPGTSYYRLKQTDEDGQFTYSKPIAIQNGEATFHLYPNPIAKGQKVSIVFNKNSIVSSVKVYSQLGKLVSDRRIETGNTDELTVEFPEGIYFIKIQTDSQVFTQKLSVLNSY